MLDVMANVQYKHINLSTAKMCVKTRYSNSIEDHEALCLHVYQLIYGLIGKYHTFVSNLIIVKNSLTLDPAPLR